MKALVKQNAEDGGVALVERPMPKPGSGEVLVKISYASICGTDIHIYKWNAWAAKNYKTPFLMGHELGGVIKEVGPNVDESLIGRKVTVETHLGCGKCEFCRTGRENICKNLRLFSKLGHGCFAEYTVVPEAMLRFVSDEIPLEYAAVMEPMGVSFRGVYQAMVAGKSVWIIGCGPIGLFAISAAKTFGASDIIATDISDYRLDIAKKLNADYTYNITDGNAAEFVLQKTDKSGVDVVIDASGREEAIQESFEGVKAGGQIVILSLPDKPLKLDMLTQIVVREIKISGCYGRKHDETWILLNRLFSSKKVNIDPILTHNFPIEKYKDAFEVAVSGNSGKVAFKFDAEC